MRELIVKSEQSKQRIDKFLVRELFSYTRAEIVRNIKNGNILVNGKKAKPSYKLKGSDIIVIPSPLSSPGGRGRLKPNPEVKFEVIYKDRDIIVVDKPAGLKTHPINYDDKNSLINGLIAKFPEIKNISDPSTRLAKTSPRRTSSEQADLRPGIVHRLDKDTSGIMIVARNQESFNELKKLFKERKITKKYLAVIHGKLKSKKGIIEKPIARAGNYKKQVIAGRKTKTKIREAVTEYKVLKEYKDYSLVELTPHTGRMHQIRIHLFSLDHPVVGDDKYKLKKTIKPKNVSRQLLHAKDLEFKLWSKKHSFQTELPEDFSDFLTPLEASVARNDK
ncbi:ribosomal large subunit pseudouridine synthase D [bacterium BMS3Abin15]|nr:ribosomal large subunit pseudouridine synthase D [bacterium BMS3Abin15]HDZ85379.1 RluA family pseudouridine synthase [Candidatus Moranbacteria bacterium]